MRFVVLVCAFYGLVGCTRTGRPITLDIGSPVDIRFSIDIFTLNKVKHRAYTSRGFGRVKAIVDDGTPVWAAADPQEGCTGAYLFYRDGYTSLLSGRVCSVYFDTFMFFEKENEQWNSLNRQDFETKLRSMKDFEAVDEEYFSKHVTSLSSIGKKRAVNDTYRGSFVYTNGQSGIGNKLMTTHSNGRSKRNERISFVDEGLHDDDTEGKPEKLNGKTLKFDKPGLHKRKLYDPKGTKVHKKGEIERAITKPAKVRLFVEFNDPDLWEDFSDDEVVIVQISRKSDLTMQ
ncbi:signal peptide-containing protein [Theileria equi strain WA]|uniref:Signal peptide-containing protein n=1 Tax=Theileria equi strain WA TaxID=1537102 RepID=L0AVG4_THEEQ|nr:signal peptide-containing protein [Theileria equi strain WA]AFZ79238.1 signal peptide-containing protein [Theileria equi strain WA]|eukprot:XP_004828904.1 signal peptide-containing protein [Theileria equi strain WA]